MCKVTYCVAVVPSVQERESEEESFCVATIHHTTEIAATCSQGKPARNTCACWFYMHAMHGDSHVPVGLKTFLSLLQDGLKLPVLLSM